MKSIERLQSKIGVELHANKYVSASLQPPGSEGNAFLYFSRTGLLTFLRVEAKEKGKLF